MKIGDMTEKEFGRFTNLQQQIDKTYKEKENSYKTEAGYKMGMEQFCKYLAVETSLNKIDNFKAREVIEFSKQMKTDGLSPSTQKTYLSAIRDFADRRGIDPRTIPSNSRLDLDKRIFGNVDRGWTEREFRDFKDAAKTYDLDKEKGDRMGLILDIAKNFGCRLEGILGIDKHTINVALNTGELWTKEKNGKMNMKPVENNKQKEILNKIKELAIENKNDKIFINQNFKETYKEVQNFIQNNKNQIQDKDRMNNIDARNKFKDDGKVYRGNLSIHGLRHSYLKDQVKIRLDKGMSFDKACSEVSKLAGHERKAVTKIYLSEAD